MKPINLDDETQKDTHSEEKHLISKAEENGIIDYHAIFEKPTTKTQPDKIALEEYSEFYILPPFSHEKEPQTTHTEISSPSFLTYENIPNRMNGELSLLLTVGKYFNVIYPAYLGNDFYGYIRPGGGGFKHTFNMSPTSERLTLIATMFLELPEHGNNSEVYKFEGAGQKGVKCIARLHATAYTTDGMFTTSIESIDHPNVPFLEKGVYGDKYNRNPVVVISMLLLKNTKEIKFEFGINSECYVRKNPSGNEIVDTYSMIDFRNNSSQDCVLPGTVFPCINKPKPGGIKITKIKCELFKNYQYVVNNDHITY